MFQSINKRLSISTFDYRRVYERLKPHFRKFLIAFTSPVEACLVTFIIIPNLFLLPNQDYTTHPFFVFFFPIQNLLSLTLFLVKWCIPSIFFHNSICARIASLPKMCGHCMDPHSYYIILYHQNPVFRSGKYMTMIVITQQKWHFYSFWTVAPAIFQKRSPDWAEPIGSPTSSANSRLSKQLRWAKRAHPGHLEVQGSWINTFFHH